MTQYLLNLKRKAEGRDTEIILVEPAFQAAMQEDLTRLKDGSAVWRTYNEVFGDWCKRVSKMQLSRR